MFLPLSIDAYSKAEVLYLLPKPQSNLQMREDRFQRAKPCTGPDLAGMLRGHLPDQALQITSSKIDGQERRQTSLISFSQVVRVLTPTPVKIHPLSERGKDIGTGIYQLLSKCPSH